MPYTMQDLLMGVGWTSGPPIGGVALKLSARPDVLALGLDWLYSTILEFSRDYPFSGLEETGPLVTLVPGQYKYPQSFFLKPGDLIPNLKPSFFLYYSYSTTSTVQNPGTKLTWKSIDAVELLLNYQGTPSYWSDYGDDIYLAMCPNQAFRGYLRYQVEHPFSSPPALTDVFKLPNEWKEIVEVAAAMRGAQVLRMDDKAVAYHNQLFGDPKRPRDVGMLAARVTKMESDIVSNQGMRQIQPLLRRR